MQHSFSSTRNAAPWRTVALWLMSGAVSAFILANICCIRMRGHPALMGLTGAMSEMVNTFTAITPHMFGWMKE